MGDSYPGTPASLNRAFYDVLAGGYPDTGGYDPAASRSPSPEVVGLLAHLGVDMDFYPGADEVEGADPYEL